MAPSTASVALTVKLQSNAEFIADDRMLYDVSIMLRDCEANTEWLTGVHVIVYVG
jgi:hypothetical protein